MRNTDASNPDNTQIDNTKRRIISVSALNRQAKTLLESHLPRMWVEGEISNMAFPSSGHWYFTLKDARAQVRCAMFKGRNRLVKVLPKDGDKVLLRANVSLYEGRGDFQLIAEHMEPAGLGDLQRQFELLKEKLHKEGLFDDDYKQELPEYPKTIAVITSPTGAAIRDILSVLQRRFPLTAVTVLPVAVQGIEAAPQIVDAIECVNDHDIADVIIVGRGGGSIEDLWAFNEEIVARAIFNSHTPVVSAVGHEVDFTIADFVADYRAPTPSAAAEIVVPDQREMAQYLEQTEAYLTKTISSKIAESRTKVKHLRKQLVHPSQQLKNHAQNVDHLEMRLKTQWRNQFGHHKHRFADIQKRFQRATPNLVIQQRRESLRALYDGLIKAHGNLMQLKRNDLNYRAALLQSKSPLGLLDRGYSVTSKENGHVIKSALDVVEGETISTRLRDGTIQSKVI